MEGIEEREQEEAKPEAAPVAAAPAPYKKVAICGCSDTKHLAPFNDPTWDIWGINNGFGHVVRKTGWFEIHPVKFEGGKWHRRKLLRPGVFEWSTEFRGMDTGKYIKMLADLDVPVYMQQHWDEIPKSVPYPLNDIMAKFGGYFTNTVSYMIALAILQGYREIGCYGVDMAATTEYGAQRPSCEFFLGVAAGLGIRVIIPDQCDLLKTRFLYGFGEREQVAYERKLALMREAMEARKAKAMERYAAAEKEIQQYVGALEAHAEITRHWSNLLDQKTWRDPQ